MIELQQSLIIGVHFACDFEALTKLHREMVVGPRNPNDVLFGQFGPIQVAYIVDDVPVTKVWSFRRVTTPSLFDVLIGRPLTRLIYVGYITLFDAAQYDRDHTPMGLSRNLNVKTGALRPYSQQSCLP